MSKPGEVYAFVTNQGWSDHLVSLFPDAIAVGADYRLLQFIRANEQSMLELAESLGFSEKRLSAADTITAMEALKLGPFIVYGDDVHAVIDHFNPVTEI